jgi:hypothetical protein
MFKLNSIFIAPSVASVILALLGGCSAVSSETYTATGPIPAMKCLILSRTGRFDSKDPMGENYPHQLGESLALALQKRGLSATWVKGNDGQMLQAGTLAQTGNFDSILAVEILEVTVSQGQPGFSNVSGATFRLTAYSKEVKLLASYKLNWDMLFGFSSLKDYATKVVDQLWDAKGQLNRAR